MKIETEIEIKTTPPKNHKWEFVRFGKASKGDSFVDNGIVGIWNTSKSINSYPIVEPVRTHHDSGISIELPDAEPPEGFKFGRIGDGIKCKEALAWWSEKNEWSRRSGANNTGFSGVVYIELLPFSS